MKKRYFEIRVHASDIPVHKRVVHVVTMNEKESPVKRAVMEGLLPQEHISDATIRELSIDECLQAWQQARWRKH